MFLLSQHVSIRAWKYVYRYHDELVNSANDNKVDNKFYFYFSEALNYKHYQAFFVFFCLFYIMRVLILYLPKITI